MMKSFGSKPLAFPTPTWVIGSYDADGKANVMTAAWGGIVSSEPPCIGVSLRESRHSYESILARGGFTISVPDAAHAREADYFGMASGRDRDKFAVSGLTPAKAEFVDAPYVAEFPMIIECRLIQSVELGIHIQLIGEIADVKVNEDVLNADGKPDMELVAPLIFAPGARTYHTVGKAIGKAFSLGKDLL
ncbi:flavin reductase family protein [Desulfovibrio ferrophilus]|uniref:Flavin reductase domain-containing protein n=1 Tax=Desulfovibrio ferrophilus TaxID=241368 RepID=A0A2Z6AU37_9BACT|nr:flavin reductase family protein [Desulfovibrio ferrophilus]BBD06742.1 flavin reductase domain-containing protein [Desulfovibrio ferrophilus]